MSSSRHCVWIPALQLRLSVHSFVLQTVSPSHGYSVPLYVRPSICTFIRPSISIPLYIRPLIRPYIRPYEHLMFVCRTVHSSVWFRPSVCLSVCPLSRPSVLPTDECVRPHVRSLVGSSVCRFVCLSINQSIYTFICLPIRPLYVHLFICPSVYRPSVLSSVRLSVRPFVCPSVSRSVHPSACSYVLTTNWLFRKAGL